MEEQSSAYKEEGGRAMRMSRPTLLFGAILMCMQPILSPESMVMSVAMFPQKAMEVTWMSTVCATSRAIVMSVVCAATDESVVLLQSDHVDVRGPCSHEKPCRCPWSVLPCEAMLISMGQDSAWDRVAVCGLY